MSLDTISAQWNMVSVGDVAQINYGKALRSEERAGEGEVPVYGSGGIVGEHNVALHSGPSIIVGRKGTVGAIYYVPGPFWCIDTAFYLSDFSSFIDVEYLAHVLRYIDLSRYSIVVGVPGINRNDVKNQKFPLPPLTEQHRIVSILRQADRLRQLRREAEGKAQQLLPALFNEIFGDPVTNPKGWPTTTMENVSLRITDGTHQPPPFTESGIPFLFVTNIIDGEINLDTTKFISHETYDTLMKRCPVERGDILYSTVGSYGVAVVVETDKPFAFQRHIAQIKPDRTIIHSLFLRSMLNSSYVKAQADQRVRGIAQGTLNLGEIAELRIFIPPFELQEEFADRVRVVQSVKTKISAVDKLLDPLFQSLLAQAFTGELTATWREEHEGLEAIRTPDISSVGVWEREDEAAVASWLPVAEPTVPYKFGEERAEPERLVYESLSDEQKTVYELVCGTKGYCTAETLKSSETGKTLSLPAIQQGLRLLTRVGLIQEVRLPHRPIRSVVYLPVYRLLDNGDRTRTPDTGVLQQALQREIAL